jgi:hypothetical protein
VGWSACDLKIGCLLAELPLAASGTVSRVLCGAGNGAFRLPLTDPATPPEWWQASTPGRCRYSAAPGIRRHRLVQRRRFTGTWL